MLNFLLYQMILVIPKGGLGLMNFETFAWGTGRDYPIVAVY